MTESADAVIIGAGVIGLAVGRALALAGRDVIVVEKNKAFGEETSARNSEVIHAGIPYRPGGMRAQFCVPGRNMLYAYCAERHVAHLQCGKLIVANGDEETAQLLSVKKTAEQNGVEDLRILSAKEAVALEQGLRCDAALFSPSTGIVDSHGLMLALLGDLENAGGVLAVSSPMSDGKVLDDGIELAVGGGDPMTLKAKAVVNCAGLWADKVAHSIAGVPSDKIPKIFYGKGQYFTYSGAAPFSRLIYPLPKADSLGVHYTPDLGGQGKLGPDLTYVASNTDYDVDVQRRDAFVKTARAFWPNIDPDKLQPGYAGIRPKTVGPGKEGDWIISGPADHGVNGYVGLYGLESPGLTACLAIADHVAEMLG